MRVLVYRFVAIFGLLLTAAAHAQLQLPTTSAPASNNSALTDPTFHADTQTLLDADKQFAAEVLQGGGSVFASWFADDAVTLNNKKSAVQGKSAIAAQTNWKPADYQLTWSPDGARLGPHGEMGITWGHYEGRSRDNQGNPLVTSGRYLTVWEKDTSGRWKVLADASNEGPPESDSCCSIH
jgi:ketosteroid isomerase-like protein